MTAMLEHLNQDHGNVARLLEVFDEQCRQHQHGNRMNLPLLVHIVRYLTQYQDAFHHPREDILFARIAQRSPASVAIVSRLEAEHGRLATLGRELYALLGEASAAPATEGIVEPQLDAYATLLREHMATESAQVFSLARIILSHGDWRDIDQALQVESDPLFGPTVEASYRIVLEHLGSASAGAR